MKTFIGNFIGHCYSGTRAEKPRKREERRGSVCSLCTAITQLARKLRRFPIPAPQADRIMAGQNHVERDSAAIPFPMILSRHDSVIWLRLGCAVCIAFRRFFGALPVSAVFRSSSRGRGGNFSKTFSKAGGASKAQRSDKVGN